MAGVFSCPSVTTSLLATFPSFSEQHCSRVISQSRTVFSISWWLLGDGSSWWSVRCCGVSTVRSALCSTDVLPTFTLTRNDGVFPKAVSVMSRKSILLRSKDVLEAFGHINVNRNVQKWRICDGHLSCCPVWENQEPVQSSSQREQVLSPSIRPSMMTSRLT